MEQALVLVHKSPGVTKLFRLNPRSNHGSTDSFICRAIHACFYDGPNTHELQYATVLAVLVMLT